MGPLASEYVSELSKRIVLTKSHPAEALTDPATWTTSGNYARGCATSGPCGYATDCQSNSITYDDGKTSFW